MVGSSCKNPKRLQKRAFFSGTVTVTVTVTVIVTVTVTVTKITF
jgi:hypothetical protein